MYLRNLCESDAEGMYEWMHDDNVISWFSFNGKGMTIEDVRSFIINNSDLSGETRHYAITDGNEYAGTLSLKNIDSKNRNAEMAISVRTGYQKTGLAGRAVAELIEIARNEINLHKIYLNVMSDNVRARRFYEKMGFVNVGTSKGHIYKDNRFIDLDWYELMLEDNNG